MSEGIVRIVVRSNVELEDSQINNVWHLFYPNVLQYFLLQLWKVYLAKYFFRKGADVSTI
jgi:hypothetical protein